MIPTEGGIFFKYMLCIAQIFLYILQKFVRARTPYVFVYWGPGVRVAILSPLPLDPPLHELSEEFVSNKIEQ